MHYEHTRTIFAQELMILDALIANATSARGMLNPNGGKCSSRNRLQLDRGPFVSFGGRRIVQSIALRRITASITAASRMMLRKTANRTIRRQNNRIVEHEGSRYNNQALSRTARRRHRQRGGEMLQQRSIALIEPQSLSEGDNTAPCLSKSSSCLRWSIGRDALHETWETAKLSSYARI